MLQPVSLATALKSIYQHSCDNQAMLELLRFLTQQLQVLHADRKIITPLNNETLLLMADQQGKWQQLLFAAECIDVVAEQALTEQQCAKNLVDIDLPDDYWRIFKHMYFNDQAIPENFNVAIESLRTPKATTAGFSKQDIWLWDEKSAQAMIVLNSRSKRYFRKKIDALKIAMRVLTALPRIFFHYKKLLHTAYQQPVTMSQRFGVALHPVYWQQEQLLLKQLGDIPVLLRFYAHETQELWQATILQIEQLRQLGHMVAIALVQDRKSVCSSKHWKRLLDTVLPAVHDKVEWIEIGHATNRVKWGLWTAADYVRLANCVAIYCQSYPKLRLVGPAVIDFEWYRLIDFLKALPRKINLFALSQHLYVDRRGAPENFQGKFSTLEKCAMSKAIAKTSTRCENRFIISEFNWPLKNTGIYSPIGSPYTAPEWFRDLPGVDEDDYAAYLIRYLAITLCSGFVEQVFLWRLSAHGYGLVDDLNGFNQRPAFHALKTFIKILGTAMFIKRWISEPTDYLFEFEKEQQIVLLGWSANAESILEFPVTITKNINFMGEVVISNNQIILNRQPSYYLLEKS